MLLDSWAPLATGLARDGRALLSDTLRGALPIRLPCGAGLRAGVFGNDGYTAEAKAKHEVSALRQRLREATLEELGFGLSEDGHAWALLVLPAATPDHSSGEDRTVARARTAFLEKAVWEAWRLACGLPPGQSPDGSVNHPLHSALACEQADKVASRPSRPPRRVR